MTTSSTIKTPTLESIVPSAAEHLVRLALEGLPQMVDAETGLFCYRLVRTPPGLMQEGVSRRYTVITLLGLHRLQQAGMTSPIDTGPALHSLFRNLTWVDNIGDLGLLLWLCALATPESWDGLARRIDLESALSRYADARLGYTMELAWFLAGLSHLALAFPEERPRLRNLTFETYRVLHRNLAPCAVFGHQARGRTLAGRFRWWMGSFADQVYPIYAITKFAQAWPNPGAKRIALDCAHSICQAQGPRGQWWWHYDASNAGSVEVVDAYPVFSVHQHGMAPMVLLEVGEAFQQDFTPWIYKGLGWIHGQNELGFQMENGSLIWRGIHRPPLQRYFEAAFRRATNGTERSPSDLRVLFECRPYELGWLLYAWAGRTGSPQP